MPLERRSAVTMIVLALLAAGCARRDGPRSDLAPPLAVYGNTATVEIAPVLLAARDFAPAGTTVRNGGIANLVGEPPVAGLGTGGVGDVATHAETQALRYSVAHPEIRIVLTVTEGRYRIVARRSAGITGLADLRGKRIATLPTTSAGYFLARMLASVGLGFGDISVVRVSPINDMAAALTRGDVDAVAIWEPHAANAARALGADRVEFVGDGVYRELFNLNTTAANLADPVKRARIVAFVRAVIQASATTRHDGAQAQALVASVTGFSREEVGAAWPTFGFIASLPDDLLDVLEAEERWLAAQDSREPRTRAALARLIDRSVYDEALK